jgi:glycerol-3-phosphate dehydrogenase
VERDLTRLGGTRYDVLVVGGGIHGLLIAWDAASRGLSVALVEQSDFGSGLSFNHQRTVHGGLRALETGDLRKVSGQIRERRTWAVLAPHLVAPLPFVIGTYRLSRRSRVLIGPAFALYNALGRQRNRGLPASLHLPSSCLVSREAVEAFPDIDRRGLTGGALWYDYQARHPDRLNGLVAIAARAAGADLANYASAVAPLTSRQAIEGARVRDELTGREVDVRARVTVLAAGASLGDLLERFANRQGPALVRAMNLLVNRPALPMAFASPGASGRMMTAVPWQGFTLVGTYQSPSAVTGNTRLLATSADIAAMLEEARVAFPSMAIEVGDIRFVHQGLTPAVVRGGRLELMPESQVLTPAWAGLSGLFGVVGVKFTTARQTAEQVVDALCDWLKLGPRPCLTSVTRLPHGGAPDDVLRSLPREVTADMEVARALIDWYGTEAPAVASLSVQLGLLDRLAPEMAVISGEVAYAVKAGHAWRLADVVFRRTPLGSAGSPGRTALARAAEVMSSLLGWSDERRREELDLVELRYRLPA